MSSSSPIVTDSLRERVVAAIGTQYELEHEIGRGGMSVVYRARDHRLNRAVAIKVLPPEMAYDPAIRTRFMREAQTSAQLAHAHIVPIYDVGERDGIAYFVMAIVSGGSLAAVLAREPRQPMDEVRRLLCEIADALAFAHLRGVIHRDIKPDNILLDQEGRRAMVTDFGIARAIEAGTRLTVTGSAVGTPTYMSPEQAMGERAIDGRSDIYSLGVLAYQMVTGRVPFTAGNSMALLLKHVSEQPKPIAELRPGAPKALCDVIERALMKAPEDRWPTAESLRDALMAKELPGDARRAMHREPVRYVTPRPSGARSAPRPAATLRREPTPASPEPAVASEARPLGVLELEQAHLAMLTQAQRDDLRLWHGRVTLLDRIKAMRGYALLTLGATVLGIVGFGAGVAEMPPLVLAPIVPIFMHRKLWKRGKSLRESGLRLRRVLLPRRARHALPAALPMSNEQRLAMLVPSELLESSRGAMIRRAAEDRAAILAIAAALSPADRAILPDLETIVDSMLERIAQLAQMLHRLDPGNDPRIDPRRIDELDARIDEEGQERASLDGERRLTLLRRQRDTLQELVERRLTLSRQLDSAGLALGNLHLDLINLRSSGLQSALTDVSSATQEVRALSRDIDVMLAAVAEVRELQ